MLSGSEALRIAAATGLPLADFLALPFRDAPEADFRIILGEKEPSSWRYHRLQLRREPTPSESHAQRCLFLQGEPGAIRCGIYPFRPRACIAFPYQEQGEAVRRSRLARVWCPPGAWVKDEVDVPAHRLLRREQASDRAHYDAVIDRWNDAAKTTELPPTTERFWLHLAAHYPPTVF